MIAGEFINEEHVCLYREVVEHALATSRKKLVPSVSLS